MRRTSRKIYLLIPMLLMCLLAFSSQTMAATISKSTIKVNVDNTYTLKVSGNKSSTEWTSSDENIVSVNKINNNQGRVTAKKKGKAVVSVQIKGEKTLKCTVNVLDPTKIRVSTKLTVGKKGSLSITGTKHTPSYSVSNKNVVSISKSSKYKLIITGRAVGTSYITVKIKNRSYKYKITVSEADKAVRLAIVGTGADVYNAKSGFANAGAKCTIVSSKSIKVNSYDGLVISGGVDINPSRYGQKNTASVGINNSLDALELALIDKFVKAEKPIFGICRGHQILNVYFKGTLKQHIPRHRGLYHKSKITTGSWLSGIYGSSLKVLSYHHQAVGKLGRGLIVIQTAPDGIVEAFVHESLPVYGVQWHPELMGSTGKTALKYFISICKKMKK